MAGTPRFKIYNPQGGYVAACKYPEEAAMLTACLGNGTTIRNGHEKRHIVWHEGQETQSASESYDYVAQLVGERMNGKRSGFPSTAELDAARLGPTIVPVNQCGDHRTGDLPPSLTPEAIAAVLGFAANIDDDESKVRFSWGFEVNGKRCGIWDYKGSRWSTFDPDNVLPELFANAIEKAA